MVGNKNLEDVEIREVKNVELILMFIKLIIVDERF